MRIMGLLVSNAHNPNGFRYLKHKRLGSGLLWTPCSLLSSGLLSRFCRRGDYASSRWTRFLFAEVLGGLLGLYWGYNIGRTENNMESTI